MDWKEIYHFNGKFMTLLKDPRFRREFWFDCDEDGHSLLFYACSGEDVDNVDAVKVLIAHGLDVNCGKLSKPIHQACTFFHAEILAILLSQGALTTALDEEIVPMFPIDIALCEEATRNLFCGEVVRVLLSNGVRLRTVEFRALIAKEHEEFEKGILQCRDVIVILLGLKRRKSILPRLDRFLIQQELAVAIWSTRADDNEAWQ